MANLFFFFQFFLKKKVLHVKSAENIFKAITGSKEVDVKKFERVHEDTATNFGIAKNLEDALGTNPKIDEKGNFTCEIVFPKQDDDIGSTSIENT